jgi:hypothetical protein
MRLMLVGAAVIGLAAALPGCVAPYGPPPAAPPAIGLAPFGLHLARVDPADAEDRAVIGTALGATLGTGLGATFAIDPGVGALFGAVSGAALGAAVGVITAQPIPDYATIAVPREAVIPGFYDTWPPGYHPPAVESQTPPPPA